MTEFAIAASLGFVAGGVLIWFGKTKIQSVVMGATALSVKLRAEADAIAAKAKAL
jgi:hypothetical protein